MVFGGASKRHCINSRKMPCQNTIGTGTARTIWNVLTVIALVWETGLWKCFVEVLIGTTSRLIDSNATNTSRKPLDPTEWILMDIWHISCRNCESQTFAFFTLRISSSSPWNSSISPKLFYCLYWPGSQCCFGVWICCPLAEATWQLAVWFGLPMRFFVVKMPNTVEVFLFDWHLQERRPGHGTEGSLATVKGQTSPTGSRTKEMFLQDHIPTIFECETTPNYCEAAIVDSGWFSDCLK